MIAAINGFAVAGGLELALMCDMRVVEDTAVLGVFCRRFGMLIITLYRFISTTWNNYFLINPGVPLIDGGTVRLPHLIGLSRALDLILTGRQVSGKEAFEIGLANRITSTGTALGKAVQLAVSLSRFPQACLLADRQSAYNAMYSAKNFESALEYEMKHGLKIIEKVRTKIFSH